MARLFARLKNYSRIPIVGFAPTPEEPGGLTWIDVREEISIGEEREIFAGAIKGQTVLRDGETRTEYDAQKITFGQVVAYLVDWDARDEKGSAVDVNPETIRGLLPDIYHVIEDAVKTHVETTRAKKPSPAQTTPDVPTLRAVAG